MASTPASQWPKVKAAFNEAVDASPAERRALLARLRATEPDVCRDVESLLEADAAGSMLLTPPRGGLLAQLEAELTQTVAPLELDEAGLRIAPGTRFGPYVVVELLGAGGMGCVYRAHDSRLDRDVALKVLRRPEEGWGGQQGARFEREAKAVAALSHPHIVAIHDFGEANGQPYMVSELLVGQTLRDALVAGPLPVRRAVELALQIARGLAAAHDKGIIHRDLKPENVFITSEGRAKLLDFGIARAIGKVSAQSATREALTGPGFVVGTVGYMSPEQALGETVTPASDVFSLGAILFEMLSGVRAFGGDSSAAKLRAVLADEPPALGATASGVPPSLGRVVRRCLGKRPDERFQSARDVAFAIEAVGIDSSVMPSAPTPAARVRRARLSTRAVVLVVLALGLLVAAVLVGRSLGSHARQEAPGAATPGAGGVVTLRTLTYSGRDTSPAASPDGRLIAFRSDRDGRARIWLRQTASGEERALTEGPDDYPRFAPDGASLIFTRTQGTTTSLFRVATLGGQPRRLLEDAGDADPSPDGKRLAFIRWDALSSRTQGRPRLFIADSDGSGASELALLDNRVRACPRFSPDGRELAVTGLAQQPGTPPTIVVVALDRAKPPRRLRAPGVVGYVSCVAWIGPANIVYAQADSVTGNSAGSPARVYLHDLLSDTARALLASPTTSLTLDILAPGTLLFDARSAQENLRELPLSGRVAPRWLSRGLGTSRQPVYSPDGKWVVFSSNQSGNLDLWAVSPPTGEIRRITDHPSEDWDPAFTPDGQLLWSSNRGGHFEVWRAAADGSGAQRVTNDGVDAENPSATRDGWVVYASGHPARRGVWKVRLDGSGATRLVPDAILPEVSPDGRYVLHQANRNPRLVEVGVSRVEDGTRVFSLSIDVHKPTPAILGRARWLPDGRRIAFVGQDSAGRNGVYAQTFLEGQDTTATRRALGGFEDEDVTESFGISPDGTRLVIARWTQSLSLMTATGLPDLSRAPAAR